MRLDHIAYRVSDRHKTVKFFVEAFGYRVQTEFEIKFDDGSTAKCFALEPPEKMELPPNVTHSGFNWSYIWESEGAGLKYEYHIPPEIFVSDGTPESIVGQWVAARGGVGGIHHMAYQVESVEKTMQEWRAKGYAEFTTEEPLRCPGLTQCFTKPSELTGVIYEFIERTAQGFCAENVKDLMLSTKNL